MSHQERRQSAAARALLEAVANVDSVLCYVPGWDVVGLERALDWLEEETHRGRRIDSRVVHEPRGAKVWLKSWELEEPEPDWEEEWPEREEA